MRPARIFAATAIGISYPSLLGVVAAGVLTFTVARVYAESAPLFQCSDPRVTECADAAASASCTACGTSPCKCQSWVCSDGGPTLPSALVCLPVNNSCEGSQFADCANKSDGDSCGASRRCVPGGCDALVDGSFENRTALVCIANAGPDAAPDADADAADPQSPGSARGPGGGDGGNASAAPAAAPSDSGCAATPESTTPGAVAGASATLALFLLWRKRRQARGAPEGHKES
jgi:hypothetical protein